MSRANPFAPPVDATAAPAPYAAPLAAAPAPTAAQTAFGGLVGAVIAVALWTVATVLTGHEIGWAAWLVGGIVGAGMMGVRNAPRGPSVGLAAAAIAIGAVLVGKFCTVTIYNMVHATPQASQVADDQAIDALAWQLEEELDEAGHELTWNDDAPADEAVIEARKRWALMEWDQRLSVKQQIADEQAYEASIDLAFTPFDLLWFFLAGVTAYKSVSGQRERTPEDELLQDPRAVVLRGMPGGAIVNMHGANAPAPHAAASPAAPPAAASNKPPAPAEVDPLAHIRRIKERDAAPAPAPEQRAA